MTHAAVVSNPASRFGARFAALADKTAMSPAHCVLYLARRVGEARQARACATWWGGRLWNRVSGAEVETVTVSGAVLVTSLTWLDETVPDGLSRAADYGLRFETAEKLERDMRDAATARGLLA